MMARKNAAIVPICINALTVQVYATPARRAQEA